MDGITPAEVELQVNLYLDPNFRDKFGDKVESTARDAVDEAGLLMQHDTLDTRIKLLLNTVHDSDLHIAFNSKAVATKDVTDRVPKLLQSPFSVEGHPVAHLYLTVPDKDFVKGVALGGSICNPEKQKPLAIVVWNKDVSTTGVTRAICWA